MAKQIISSGDINITVVGKINLPSKKKRKFRPYSGGMTIGNRLKAKGQSISF